MVRLPATENIFLSKKNEKMDRTEQKIGKNDDVDDNKYTKLCCIQSCCANNKHWREPFGGSAPIVHSFKYFDGKNEVSKNNFVSATFRSNNGWQI